MGKLKIGRAEDASAFDRSSLYLHTHVCYTTQPHHRGKRNPTPHPTEGGILDHGPWGGGRPRRA